MADRLPPSRRKPGLSRPRHKKTPAFGRGMSVACSRVQSFLSLLFNDTVSGSALSAYPNPMLSGILPEARLAFAPGQQCWRRIKRATASWRIPCYRRRTWNGHAQVGRVGRECQRTGALFVCDEKRHHSPEGATRVVRITRTAIQDNVRCFALRVETDHAGACGVTQIILRRIACTSDQQSAYKDRRRRSPHHVLPLKLAPFVRRPSGLIPLSRARFWT